MLSAMAAKFRKVARFIAVDDAASAIDVCKAAAFYIDRGEARLIDAPDDARDTP